MGLFCGLDSVQPFLELYIVVFESVVQWHAKKVVVDWVYGRLVIGVWFCNPDSEAMKPYLDGSRDGVTMEGSIPCIPTLDADFNNGLGKLLTQAGDDICVFIKVGVFRVSQEFVTAPLFA